MSTTTQWSATTSMDVLLEVLNERNRQDEKWGQQNHPDLWEATQEEREAAQAFSKEMADGFKQQNDDPNQPTDWAGILFEEVFEAVAEGSPLKIRAELIQVAAVAVAWIEAIDRRDL